MTKTFRVEEVRTWNIEAESAEEALAIHEKGAGDSDSAETVSCEEVHA